MKYAWIENQRIRDIALGNPVELYHSDVAKFYDTQVPDGAANGDGWVEGQVVKPVLPEPYNWPVSWVLKDIREGLSLLERVKWDNDETNRIKTAKIELEGISYEAKVKEVLDMLVSNNDISQESANVILSKTVNKVIGVTIT
jgi:hypothetical protein